MLYYNTISVPLRQILLQLMAAPAFNQFRLVGGTALSLQLGYRKSVDIDLFSDSPYGNIDFDAIEHFLKNNFTYLQHFKDINPGLGKSYIIGANTDDAIKVDVFYTDPFIQPSKIIDGIRLASVEEIIAMKIDIVQRGGRKKDFWDLHELLQHYSIQQMLQFHLQRYEFNHDEKLILHNLTDFSIAEDDFTPVCLLGKHWEFIKEDFVETVAKHNNGL
ncbi:MAG: nucleotidyl transferase AbiEii/AbiGii toxin family protein [Chitinophagaceae bacterium]|nr:nucleotidyl transferase AbiEii/AbiGii toxin family protein [Chitinophagaceae bacterium]